MTRIRNARDLGIMLRNARKTAGMTQAQVAAKLRSTQAWVSAVEGGKDTVELGRVLRLAALLNVRLSVDDNAVATEKKAMSGGIEAFDLRAYLESFREES